MEIVGRAIYRLIAIRRSVCLSRLLQEPHRQGALRHGIRVGWGTPGLAALDPLRGRVSGPGPRVGRCSIPMTVRTRRGTLPAEARRADGATMRRRVRYGELVLRLVVLEYKRAIVRTLYRYEHALDYGFETEWADCFTPDGSCCSPVPTPAHRRPTTSTS
jgi:hypothetical protein